MYQEYTVRIQEIVDLLRGRNPLPRLETDSVWDQQIIDQCIVITFNKNQSYSGEKTVEIHCHGSIAIIEKLVSIFKCKFVITFLIFLLIFP